jgi:hypothetical protein
MKDNPSLEENAKEDKMLNTISASGTIAEDESG